MQNETAIRSLWIGLLLWGLLGVTAPLAAQETPSAPGAGPPASRVAPAAQRETARKEKKRQAATIALYLLVGIAMLGMTLVVWTVLWGRQMRRSLHRKLPAATRGDDFWFMKRKAGEKPATADPPPRTDEDG